MKRLGFAVLAMFLMAGALPAQAVPPHPYLAREIREGRRPVPEYMRQLKEKGPPKLRGDRQVRSILQKLKKRRAQDSGTTFLPAPGTTPLDGAAVDVTLVAPPALGTVNALALQASFADVSPIPAILQQLPDYYDKLVFGGTAPSLSHYFLEVSAGKFEVVTENPPSGIQCTPGVGSCTTSTPPGWLPLPQTKATYRTDLRAMLQDAVAAAKGSVDFSRYDNDGDGFVDYLILIHAGSGGEYTGDNNDIWSQTVTVAPVEAQPGVFIDTFITVPEYWAASRFGRMTLGVYAHEFGHLLGLPDLYDYDFDSKGIGDWGLMGLGMWNGPNPNATDRGQSPSWPSAWSRVALGWVAPEVPVSDLSGVTLLPVEQAGPVYLLWDFGDDNNEFFLIENRQKLPGTYDAYLPHHGLLVWHIDENMPHNNWQIDATSPWRHDDCYWPNHYRVALQQADGWMDLENNVSSFDGEGDVADPYPGNFNFTVFSPTSTPNSGSYADCSSLVAIRNIQELGTTVILDLEVSGPPELVLADYQALSPPSPGSDVPFTVSLANDGGEATGITAQLVSLDPLVSVTSDWANYPDLPHGGTAANDADPFQLALDPALTPGTVVALELHVSAAGWYSTVLSLQLTVDASGVESLVLIRPDLQGGADILAQEWFDDRLQDPAQAGVLPVADNIYLRGDVNGDGLRDIVRGKILGCAVAWSVHLAFASAAGVVYEESPTGLWHPGLGSLTSRFFLGDADGDGRKDLVFTEASGRRRRVDVWVSLSDGQAFGPPVKWYAGLPLPDRRKLLVGDVDGDGMADLVQGTAIVVPRARCAWRVALSDGFSFRPAVIWGRTPLRITAKFLLGDVDGDGREDLVFTLPQAHLAAALKWGVKLSDGLSFVAGERWLNGFGRRGQKFELTDIDGDRRFDLLAWQTNVRKRIFRAARSTGAAFELLGEVGRFPSRISDVVLP